VPWRSAIGWQTCFPDQNLFSRTSYIGTFTVKRLLIQEPWILLSPLPAYPTPTAIYLIFCIKCCSQKWTNSLAGSFTSFGSQAGAIIELNTDGSPSRALLTVTTPNPV